MNKKLIRKTLAFLMALVMTTCLVNVNIIRADVEIPYEDKYENILPLFKTLDEAIEEILDRVEYDNAEEITCLIKSKNEKVTSEDFMQLLRRRSMEYVFNPYSVEDNRSYEFKIGDWYYQKFKIIMVRPYNETKINEYTAKVKYVEHSLGLFDENVCEYEKTALIYNYITNNVSYGSFPGENDQYAYSALMKGKAVCSGYTCLFQDMLKDVGIKSLYVTSNDHAWNLVEIGDKWYFCDATNGSAGLCVGGDYNGTLVVSGFLLGSIEDSKKPHHEIDTRSNKLIDYYKCSISDTTLAKKEPGMSYETLFKMYDYKAPSCTESGGYRIECEYCNDNHEVTIPPTHYYTYTTTKEPTCDEAGSCTATCKLCGHSKEEALPKYEHSWDYRYYEATCEKDGYEKVWCEKCNKVYWNEDIPALIHDWSEWENGSIDEYKKTCSKCGKKQYEYKAIIDGKATADDLIKKDRGYGIIAYYSIFNEVWIGETEDGDSRILGGHTRIWRDSINGYVKWDAATHTFVEADDTYNSTTETPETTKPVTTPNTETTKPETTKPETTTKKDTQPATTTKKQVTTTKKNNSKPSSTTKVKKSTKVQAPGKVKDVELTAKKKALKVTWKKISGVKKYQVQVCTSKKFEEGVIKKKTSNNSLTVKKLKTRKKYYVRVRAVKESKGKTAYGKWSKVVHKKTKK